MSIQQEDAVILNVYASNNRTLKNQKQKLRELKAVTDYLIITVQKFKALNIDRKNGQKINNDVGDLKTLLTT